jgi:hypothetical protein
MDEFLYSLGVAIRAKEGKTSIAKLISALADDVERRSELKKRAI